MRATYTVSPLLNYGCLRHKDGFVIISTFGEERDCVVGHSLKENFRIIRESCWKFLWNKSCEHASYSASLVDTGIHLILFFLKCSYFSRKVYLSLDISHPSFSYTLKIVNFANCCACGIQTLNYKTISQNYTDNVLIVSVLTSSAKLSTFSFSPGAVQVPGLQNNRRSYLRPTNQVRSVNEWRRLVVVTVSSVMLPWYTSSIVYLYYWIECLQLTNQP